MKKGKALLEARVMFGPLGHVQTHGPICSVGTISPVDHAYGEYGTGSSWDEAFAEAAKTKEAML